MTVNYCAAHTTAVLLAAGHGKRMLPLTQHTPKPLLKVGEYALIEHHLRHLQAQGFRHVVINIAYLGEQIRVTLGNGQDYGLRIDYSDESSTGALETAGGLKQALPLIKSDPFLVINSDIWTDMNFTELLTPLKRQGRLMLVDNPEHNPDGDFSINVDGKLSATNNSNSTMKTFSGIALYQKAIFNQLEQGKQPLAPLLKSLIAESQLEWQQMQNVWVDVGTPERLELLRGT